VSRPLNRHPPKLAAAQMKTYAIEAPAATHFRAATCEQAGCEAYRQGWQLRKEVLSPELLHAVETSGRSYTEMPVRDGETWLVFAPGQPCFRAAAHRVRLDRPELYVVRGGDWRGDPMNVGTQVHSGPDAWADDFATHQDKLANEGKKG
jgi:hypothetical protein